MSGGDMKGRGWLYVKMGFWKGLLMGFLLGLIPSIGLGYLLYKKLNVSISHMEKINEHLIWIAKNVQVR
jgi:hypothetical protein